MHTILEGLLLPKSLVMHMAGLTLKSTVSCNVVPVTYVRMGPDEICTAYVRSVSEGPNVMFIVAETVQHFITAMDSVKLNMQAVDQVRCSLVQMSSFTS